MDVVTRRSQAARLRKRAQIHRLRSIGCEPEERAMELDLAQRLTRIAHGLETGTLPETGKPE